MDKKVKAKAKKNKGPVKSKEGLNKPTKERVSFKEWRKAHRKGLLITYYSVATVVIVVCIGIILNSFVTRTDTIESEAPIYFHTEYEDDDSLELGTEEVKQAGENGTKRVYTKEKKKLITGEVLESYVAKEETVKEPVKEIVRRGTRKWQYMICSDGSWRYFTDEQFQDPNIGFTHSSEDFCAKNNQGTMVALADNPPAASSYTSDGKLSKDYIRAMEIRAEYEQELRDRYTNSTSPTEPFNSSIDYNPFAEYEARMEQERQAREKAESTCRSQAESARESVRRQLGAMGVGGSQLTTVPQEAYDSTYSSCMRGYGY